jgi:hypothetical protein
MKIFKDGDMWCGLVGDNLQNGMAVFSQDKHNLKELFIDKYGCIMSPDCPCNECQKENIKMD